MNTPIEISTSGNWLGSTVAWVLDAFIKAFKSITSPSRGYAIAGVLGESTMDFNSKGGEVVGLYGVAEGHGVLGADPVNDVVGVSGTARKNTNCWAAGGHFDVYDTVDGGTAIGVNVEMIGIKPGTWGIGVNVQPYPDSAPIIGVNLQNKVKTILNTEGAHVNYLATINSASPMFSSVAPTQVVGRLRIKIDGSDYFIPVYK